jgi:hypothetical protein
MSERCWTQQAARLLIMERPAPCMQISKPRVIQVPDCLCSPKEVAVKRKHGGEVFSAMNASQCAVNVCTIGFWFWAGRDHAHMARSVGRRVYVQPAKGEKGGRPDLSAAVLKMHAA